MTTAGLAAAGHETFPESGSIPIRNIWHMLLYAWNLAIVDGRRFVDVEDLPTLDALFARILVQGVREQIRRGLGRAYRTQERTLRGIRGRIDFEASLKRLTFSNGQAHCRFQEFSVNVPRNQIIRSTLAMLAREGEFGVSQSGTEDLAHALRRLVRDLDGVNLVPNSLELIGRQNLGRSDSESRIMLNVCELLWRCHMPTESAGAKAMVGLDRVAMTLHAIYERFVANFYRSRLGGWIVGSQVPMSWNAERSASLLPAMRPDLQFRHRQTGRLVILDTKFTAHSTVRSYVGGAIFNSSHLYQMYAYLRSQEELSEIDRNASGVLLYPTVQRELDETVILQGHPIRVVTVDLARPWRDIEDKLLSVFS